MRLLLALIAAILVGSAVGVAIAELGGHPAPVPHHYINMEGAAKSALIQAAKAYGLVPPQSGIENNGSSCPSHVLAKKGQLFWCQALLEGKLVPVEMKLISSLGFFRIVEVGQNRALENEQNQRLSAEYREKCEYEFPSRGRRYHSCMYY